MWSGSSSWWLTERRGGVLSKFLGDGALIYFPEHHGSPRWQGAVCCARLCLDLGGALSVLSADWRRRGLTIDLTTRAGVASGYCAIGDWGSGPRLDYTPIGTPVNLASRLQSVAPAAGILLAANTAALLAEDAVLVERIRPGKRLTVKGFGGCMVHELSANVRANSNAPRTLNGQDLSQGLSGGED
jgi:class 3 adenylate cyclase